MKQIKLLMLVGLPGVGKTTLAHALAEYIRAEVITSEKIIGELFRESLPKDKDADYSEQQLTQGYRAIAKKVREAILSGKTVIVEGSFRSQSQRNAIRQIAEELKIPLFLIHVICQDSILKERIEKRFQSGQHQFGYQAHLAVKRVYEPILNPDFTINTSEPTDPQIKQLLQTLGLSIDIPPNSNE